MKSIRQYLLIFISAVLLLPVKTTFSQDEKWNDVNFKADLESILQLNIDPDAKVEFGMREINDNLFQITSYPEPVMFSVDATMNWNLTFATSSEYFTGENDSSLQISVDFMGYTIESYGSNWDNGNFSNIINLTKDTLFPLTSERCLVLKNGRRNNIGGSQQNFFIIRWRFFDDTDQIDMNKFSNMKMANDVFKVGLKLTLSENLTIDSNN